MHKSNESYGGYLENGAGKKNYSHYGAAVMHSQTDAMHLCISFHVTNARDYELRSAERQFKCKYTVLTIEGTHRVRTHAVLLLSVKCASRRNSH